MLHVQCVLRMRAVRAVHAVAPSHARGGPGRFLDLERHHSGAAPQLVQPQQRTRRRHREAAQGLQPLRDVLRRGGSVVVVEPALPEGGEAGVSCELFQF